MNRSDWARWMASMVLACFLCVAPRIAQAQVNRIVAIVNDEAITLGDLTAHMSALLQQVDTAELGEEQSKQMREAVLQRLINERLMVQEAKRLGLSVGLEEVSERLQEIREQLGDPAEYERMLRETQLNEEQLKQKIRDQLLVQQVIQREVRSKLELSPTEVARAAGSPAPSNAPMEQVHVAHLLIRATEERSADEARRIVEHLHDELQAGAKFSELAQRYSEDGHGKDGGDLGWVDPGDLLPELDAVLPSLKPGEHSAPIQTKLGSHLVQVLDRRMRTADQADASRRRTEEALYERKFGEAMRNWLQQLNERAYVQVLEPGE